MAFRRCHVGLCHLGSAAVILDSAGRLLMVHHSCGHLNWELPGGGSESGESAIGRRTSPLSPLPRGEGNVMVSSSAHGREPR